MSISIHISILYFGKNSTLKPTFLSVLFPLSWFDFTGTLPLPIFDQPHIVVHHLACNSVSPCARFDHGPERRVSRLNPRWTHTQMLPSLVPWGVHHQHEGDTVPHTYTDATILGPLRGTPSAREHEGGIVPDTYTDTTILGPLRGTPSARGRHCSMYMPRYYHSWFPTTPGLLLTSTREELFDTHAQMLPPFMPQGSALICPSTKGWHCSTRSSAICPVFHFGLLCRICQYDNNTDIKLHTNIWSVTHYLTFTSENK